MIPIRTRAKVSPDGKIIVAVGAADAGKDVEVLVSSIDEPENTIHGLPRADWIQRFDQTAGSVTDETFTRLPQSPQGVKVKFD